MAFKLLPGKFDKRVSSFTAECTDIKITDGFGDDFKLVIEFGDEPVLSVNLNYGKWVNTDDGKSPKTGSAIYKLIDSVMKQGIEFDTFNVEEYQISTTPSLLGKMLTFDAQVKSFEAPDTGEVKQYYIWTLKKVGGIGQPAPKASKAPAQPEQKETSPVDMAVVEKGWIQLIDSISETKFTFPQLIAARSKFLQEVTFSDAEKEYFAVSKKFKEMLASMVSGGYVTQKGLDYIKNDDAILAGLMA